MEVPEGPYAGAVYRLQMKFEVRAHRQAAHFLAYGRFAIDMQ